MTQTKANVCRQAHIQHKSSWWVQHLKDDENTNTREHSSQDLQFLQLAIKQSRAYLTLQWPSHFGQHIWPEGVGDKKWASLSQNPYQFLFDHLLIVDL